MTFVAVLGASGFVGRRVCEALRSRGAIVRKIPAPRLSTSRRDLDALEAEPAFHRKEVSFLAEAIRGADAVINAAGVATATRGDDDALFGANALLPGLVARACGETGIRFVQVSSAAVQGRRSVLDESADQAPFSPYSVSKALGEALVLKVPGTVVFRPTSVQGLERKATRQLTRYASSRVPIVAAPGDDPTPQVHVTNVADAIAFVALAEEAPPRIVLQPDEGLTTAELVRVLGAREPLLAPRSLARAFVALLFLAGRLSGRMAGVARRVEVLWFGQRQASGWLQGRWTPVVMREGWRQFR